MLCSLMQVPTGEYRLSALAATPESAPELLFLPSHMDIAVGNPLFNIEFSQVSEVHIGDFPLFSLYSPLQKNFHLMCAISFLSMLDIFLL